jgi:GntR family transcriptional regulator
MPSTYSLPLYIQISEMLIREIQAGRLPDGARLPPEREMAADLKISVGTLRKALTVLAEKKLLERRQGSGNYVRQGSGGEGLYAFFRLELIGGGGLPTAQVISVQSLEKPADLPNFGSSMRAHRIRRLRRLNGIAVAVEEIWLDAGYATILTVQDLSESLYYFYQNRLKLSIHRVEDSIGIGSLPNWARVYLPEAKEVLGCVDRISWDQSNLKAEVSRTWFDTEKASFISRLK